MKKLIFVALYILFGLNSYAQTTLIKNVNIFDGTSDKLFMNHDVLIEENLIKEIGIGLTAPDSARIIDGQGKTLMPGLHDMHTHISLFRPVATGHRDAIDPFQTGAVASARVEGLLMSGFTTIRDIGGPAKYMQKVVDAGVVPGPRIYPSEAIITQTSGHGDFRELNDVHPNMHGGTNHWFEEYFSFICDGRAEVLRGTRESLRRGATQIKITASGGVSSEFDPLHSIQYTPEEVQAAVEAAGQWSTYVAAHCFTDASIKLCVENGVKCIEHGPMMTEESAKLLSKEGIWLVPSLHALLGPTDEQFRAVMSDDVYAKAIKVRAAVEKEMEYASKYNVKMAFGTDLLTNWENAVSFGNEANKEFEHLARFVGNFEALKMATSNAGELAKMCGPPG